MARIEISTYVAAPPERCFDLARSVELHTRSTGATGECAVSGQTSGLLGDGAVVTWRARHLFAAPFGPLGWLAEQLFLTRYMRAFLVRRNEEVKAIAESADWRQFVAPSV